MEANAIPNASSSIAQDPRNRPEPADAPGRRDLEPEAACRMAAQLAREIDPGRRNDLQVDLDSTLERDLGFWVYPHHRPNEGASGDIDRGNNLARGPGSVPGAASAD